MPSAEAALVLVEFPGCVENVDRALEMLGPLPTPEQAAAAGRIGGETEEAMEPLGSPTPLGGDGSELTADAETPAAEQAQTKKESLELNFRPHDMWSIPIKGQAFDTSNLLLKVTRKRKAPSSACSSSAARPSKRTRTTEEVTSEIVGVVEKTYRFDAMADFQFVDDEVTLPHGHAEGDSTRAGKLLAMVLGELPLVGQEERKATLQRYNHAHCARVEAAHDGAEPPPPLPPLLVVPGCFSRRNYRPKAYGFVHNKSFQYVRQEDGSVKLLAKSGVPKPRNGMVQAIGVKQATPAGPKRRTLPTVAVLGTGAESASGQVRTEAVDEEEATGATKECMEWLKALFAREDGPDAGRKVWTRPALAARVPTHLATELGQALPFVAYRFRNGPYRSSWCPFGYDPRKDPSTAWLQSIDYRMTEEQAELAAALARSRKQAGEAAGDRERVRKLSCLLLPPEKNQAIYQICDIHDHAVQAMAEEAADVVFTERNGWLTATTIRNIRTRLFALVDELLGVSSAAVPSMPVALPESVQAMLDGIGDSSMLNALVGISDDEAEAFGLLDDDDDDDDDEEDEDEDEDDDEVDDDEEDEDEDNDDFAGEAGD